MAHQEPQQHGMPSYRRGCRCPECRTANTQVVLNARQKRKERLAKGLVEDSEFQHGAGAYNNWGCRCVTCTTGRNLQSQPTVARWRERNPQAVKEQKARWAKRHPEQGAARTKRHTSKWQGATLDRAGQHRQPWTDQEIEIALRDDLSARQVALAIGRTLYAVRGMRERLKAANPNGAT